MFLSGDTSHYLFTQWRTVLLEKLIGSQLVKKFPSFYVTRRFNTPFTCPSPVPIRSLLHPVHAPHYTSWRSILILSSYLSLGLPSGLFPWGFPTKTQYTLIFFPIRTTSTIHLLDLITRKILGEEYTSLITYSFLHSPVTSSLLGPNTVQPMAHRILSHWKMSQNLKKKKNCNYNLLHLVVA